MGDVTSNWSDFDFDKLCEKLAKRENFSFSRWGDGEWNCVLGKEGRNCDGHPYAADLSLSLAAVLLSEQAYYMGMQPKAQRDMGGEVQKWIADKSCQVEWCNADIIHDASIDDRLDEMARALLGRNIILVAPLRLKRMAHKLQAYHVVCPLTNVWKWYTTIYGDVVERLQRDVVVLYCMSMPAKVMINQFAREYGDTITQVDIGSAFDPYCGFRTRRYHEKIIERIKEGA